MSRIVHFLFFVMLVALAQNVTATNTETTPALRILCENHPVSANGLVTQRSDSITDFIPASINILDFEGQSLSNIGQLYLSQTDGLKATGFLIAKSESSTFGLYRFALDYTQRSSTAELITDNITDLPIPYTYSVTPEGLWVQTKSGALQFFGYHSQKVNKIMKINGQLASRQGLVIKVFENGLQSLKKWNSQSGTWLKLGSTQNKNQSIELLSSSDQNWLTVYETQSGLGQLHKIFFKNKELSLQARTLGKPVVIFRKGQFSLVWVEERLTEKRKFEATISIAHFDDSLKVLKIEKLAIPAIILNQVEKSINTSGQVFNPTAFDEANDVLIFSSSHLGGVARLNLTTSNFELVGNYGRSWACYNPVSAVEVTAW